MRIHLYAKDEAGLVTYQGPSDGWESEEQLLEHYGAQGAPAVEHVTGWPHAQVRWYGNVGVGDKKRGAPAKLEGGRRRNIYIDDESWRRAIALGGGNASDGIRIALAPKLDDEDGQA